MGRLDGKVCVITGAGGGMGREAAILFSEEGASVCAADVNFAAAEETVARGRRRLRAAGRRRRRGERQGDDGRDGRALRRHRRPLQQRRDLARRRRLRPRHQRRVVGPRAGREHARRLPLLQARDPAPAAAGRRLGDQRGELRRDRRRGDQPDLVHGVEGRRARDVARAGRAVRPREHPRERPLPRPGRDAAAALDLRRRPGRARTAPHPLADRPPREAARGRERRAVPRVRRVVVRERLDVPRRRRPDRVVRDAGMRCGSA